MSNILAVSGSPSLNSRTAALVRHVGGRLEEDGHEVRHLAVRDLPAEPLLTANTAHPAIRRAVESVEWADAVIVGTPVYKASYSGLLKTLLDLLPQSALEGRTVLPLATGGSPAHVLALDYGLRPVLTSLGTDSVLRGWFVLDKHVVRDAEGGPGVIAPEAAEGVAQAVDRLRRSLAAGAAQRQGLASVA